MRTDKKCAAGAKKIIRFHPVRSVSSVSYAAAPGNDKMADDWPAVIQRGGGGACGAISTLEPHGS